MRKFRFGLEQLLALRRQMLEQAERRLSQLAQDKNRWQQELLSLESDLREPMPGIASPGSALRSSLAWDARYRYFEGIQAHIDEAQEKVEALTAEWQTARQVYQQLASKTDALENLRKRKQLEHEYEFSRWQQVQLDDHVLRQRARESES